MEFHILRFIDHAHTTTAELLYDAIMRNGLADQRVGGWHVEHILGRTRNQVNEDRPTAYQLEHSMRSQKSENPDKCREQGLSLPISF